METASIPVVQLGSRWIAKSSFAQKDIVKAAGFRWDPAAKCWWTDKPDVAASLADPDAAERIKKAQAEKAAAKAQAIAASRAADADIDIPVPEGLSYLPYQRAGIAFGLAHPNVLFGDEMGLGKTIQAIGIINADESLKRILVVCPASLRLNWLREMEKWLTRKYSKAIITTGSSWIDAEITIINYDILTKHLTRLQSVAWDSIILDEAHYLKNPDAKRTQAVVGQEETKKKEGKPELKARRRLALTGTPIPNRPIEGWPIFHYLDPGTFPKFWYYVKDYCDAHQNGYGWDFSGASNLDKLQDKLRSSIMVRRKKADVLTELPAKQRQLVELDPSRAAMSAVQEENEAFHRHEHEIVELRTRAELAKAGTKEEYEEAVNLLKARTRAAFTEMSDLRHRTAVSKLPQVIEHITDALEEEGHKIVLFAHHKDVVAGIMDALSTAGVRAVSITGDTPMETRQANVDEFQTSPECRVFVGNIQAAGVGLTLTAAAHVIFAELDWVPGNVTQAEDRCHRIGQHDAVLVQHLVLDGSLDAKMAKTLIGKQAVIDAALDNNERAAIAEEIEAPIDDRPATVDVTREKVAEIAVTLTETQISAIHQGLQILADYDVDRARDLNGMGFNKMDSGIGHSLAERAFLSPKQAALGLRLVTKYRRQLPAEVLEAAGVPAKKAPNT